MWTDADVLEHPMVKQMRNLPYEVSLALYLTPTAIRTFGRYSELGDDQSVKLPHAEEIVMGCRYFHTRSVIVVHNHPDEDGDADPHPSHLDIQATNIFKQQLAGFGIELVDHIIVTRTLSFSFAAFQRTQSAD